MHRKTVLPALALAVTVVATLPACKKAAEETAAPAAAPAPVAWQLDDSKLTPEIRFAPADFDTSKKICDDLDGYVNQKWLAANPIPADQVWWGPFAALRERSLDVRHQIAEHLASTAPAGGIEKIVADFWTSGMDEARVEQLGLSPLKDRLAAIDALDGGPAVAEYLRKVAVDGGNPLFDFAPEADFKNSAQNIAYASQGGLGLPDKTYYFDADKKAIREAYEKHIAKVLELSGVASGDALTQARSVLAFETRLAKVSKSQEELSRDVELYYPPVSPADADKLT
ncbi:MAG: peptidase, partial [Solimonas sp.]